MERSRSYMLDILRCILKARKLFQNYDTSESKLRREFEVYGPVKKV